MTVLEHQRRFRCCLHRRRGAAGRAFGSVIAGKGGEGREEEADVVVEREVEHAEIGRQVDSPP